jgi:hypothetical protein
MQWHEIQIRLEKCREMRWINTSRLSRDQNRSLWRVPLHLLILELSVLVLLIVTWLALGLRQVASAIEPVVGRFDVGRGNEKEPVIVLICEILAAE